MSRLSEFLGKFEIKIDGKDMEISPLLEDKFNLMAVKKTMSEKTTDEDTKKIYDIYRKILKQSFADADEAEINQFLLKYADEFSFELSIAFGWLTREDVEKLKSGFLDKRVKNLE